MSIESKTNVAPDTPSDTPSAPQSETSFLESLEAPFEAPSVTLADSGVTRHRVVVGFDGSPGAEAAVEWAAREAEVRASSLRVVTCWAVPHEVDYYGVGARQAASLAAVVSSTHARHPNLVIGSATTHLDPREALLAEASSADLLVIGQPKPGGAKDLLLGSVTRTAARRSPCPVVVARGSTRRQVRRIVVGIDGSNASAVALDWACAEANLHQADLCTVHAHERDISIAEAQCIVDLAVNECRDRTTRPVVGELHEGSAADAIISAGRGADLIAIGSRGRSGFKTALFGSVALTVAERAECPVAIMSPRIRVE